MRAAILRNFIRPMLERLGTMTAAYLIAKGLDGDLVAQLINSVVAALLVLMDLLIAKHNRQEVD